MHKVISWTLETEVTSYPRTYFGQQSFGQLRGRPISTLTLESRCQDPIEGNNIYFQKNVFSSHGNTNYDGEETWYLKYYVMDLFFEYTSGFDGKELKEFLEKQFIDFNEVEVIDRQYIMNFGE